MHWFANRVLDSVEIWADKYWLTRETECFVKGRIDGLLIPTAFDAHCVKSIQGHYASSVRVLGVEVKVSRSDFQNGMKNGQYDRYNDCLGGLYIATPTDVCKTAEIPKHIGHLQIDRRPTPWRCICKRHPEYRDAQFTPEQIWQLFFRFVMHQNDELREQREHYEECLKRVGKIAGDRVFTKVQELGAAIDEQVESLRRMCRADADVWLKTGEKMGA